MQHSHSARNADVTSVSLSALRLRAHMAYLVDNLQAYLVDVLQIEYGKLMQTVSEGYSAYIL